MTPRHSILSLSVLATIVAGAQDLNREITVDREILPVEADASRLPVLPQVDLPAIPTVSLSPTRVAVTTAVLPHVRQLDPVKADDPSAPPDARGYAVAGVGGPDFTADLSAGYRLVSTASTRVGAWLQWNSDIYSRNSARWRTHAGTVGVDAIHRFNANSLLEASASWAIDRFNMPRNVGYWQTSNRADIDLAWHSKTGGMNYNIKGAYGYFGYSDSPAELIDGMRQNRVGFGADGWLPTSDNGFAGVSVDLDLLNTVDAKTSGVVSLTPGWRFKNRVWTIVAGPRVDLTFNGDKALHIAPDVRLGFSPSSFFVVKLSAGGGEQLNPLASLAQLARRQSPCVAYGVSHVPVSVDGTITIGPLKGAWLSVFGGWAKANSWLMPEVMPDGGMAWMPQNLSGGKFGGEIGAAYRSIVELTARYTAASSSFYLNRDRARHSLDVKLGLRPLAPLRITATYELRASRSITTAVGMANLSNESMLSVNASYAFTRKLSVWINARNLLNRSSQQIDLTPVEGTGAMVGVSCLF